MDDCSRVLVIFIVLYNLK